MKSVFKYNSILYKKKGSTKGENKPYQDAITSYTYDDGISVGAIADGLGSKKKSDVGAKIAVETATEFLHDYFAYNIVSPLIM